MWYVPLRRITWLCYIVYVDKLQCFWRYPLCSFELRTQKLVLKLANFTSIGITCIFYFDGFHSFALSWSVFISCYPNRSVLNLFHLIWFCCLAQFHLVLKLIKMFVFYVRTVWAVIGGTVHSSDNTLFRFTFQIVTSM